MTNGFGRGVIVVAAAVVVIVGMRLFTDAFTEGPRLCDAGSVTIRIRSHSRLGFAAISLAESRP